MNRISQDNKRLHYSPEQTKKPYSIKSAKLSEPFEDGQLVFFLQSWSQATRRLVPIY